MTGLSAVPYVPLRRERGRISGYQSAVTPSWACQNVQRLRIQQRQRIAGPCAQHPSDLVQDSWRIYHLSAVSLRALGFRLIKETAGSS